MGEPIPITNMFIHRITKLPYQGVDLAQEFKGENKENKLTNRMKNEFGLMKKSHGYFICSITDKAMKFAARILACKVMRNNCMDEVLVPLISLTKHYVNGVQYKWVHYLFKEFLLNFREAQNDGKAFHYALLLLLISLVAWRLLEDSQLTPKDVDLPEAMMFASLWRTKDLERVMETKLFWVLIEMDLYTVIS